MTYQQAVHEAHRRARVELRGRGAPSPDVPSSIDVLHEMRVLGVATDHWSVKRYLRTLELCVSDL